MMMLQVLGGGGLRASRSERWFIHGLANARATVAVHMPRGLCWSCGPQRGTRRSALTLPHHNEASTQPTPA